MEVVEGSRSKGERYSEEEIERGLLEVAMCRGNTRRAARQLKAQGLAIPRPTLETWASRLHPDRYRQVQEQVLPMIHQRMAEQSEELAQAYADAEHEALAHLREQVPNMKAGEAAGRVRAVRVHPGGTTRQRRPVFALLGVTPVNGRLMTAAEVAELLGVPTTWIYEMSRKGEIPTVTLGRYRRYRREAIEAGIEEQKSNNKRRHT